MSSGQLEYDIAELVVTDKQGILLNIRPYVLKFFSNEFLFVGPFRLAYLEAADEFIVGCIREEIATMFYIPQDEMYAIVDKHFIAKITGDYFFNKDNYKLDN